MMVVFLIMLQSQLVKWEVLCLSCSLPLQDSSRVSSVRQSLKMGDANLVNGAQMGPCVVQEMAATKCPPRTWLAGWQSSWQESIYLYCPSWLLEVATALWWYPLHRFYSELQNAGDQKTSVSGGYLTDPLYLSRLKGLLEIIIQSEISRPNQLSLVTAPEVGTKVGNDWRWWKKNHFWRNLFSRQPPIWWKEPKCDSCLFSLLDPDP